MQSILAIHNTRQQATPVARTGYTLGNWKFQITKKKERQNKKECEREKYIEKELESDIWGVLHINSPKNIWHFFGIFPAQWQLQLWASPWVFSLRATPVESICASSPANSVESKYFPETIFLFIAQSTCYPLQMESDSNTWMYNLPWTLKMYEYCNFLVRKRMF